MKGDKSLYLNIILGTIGIIFIALGFIEYFALVESSRGFILALLGVTITVHYLYHLEKRAGISDNLD